MWTYHFFYEYVFGVLICVQDHPAVIQGVNEFARLNPAMYSKGSSNHGMHISECVGGGISDPCESSANHNCLLFAIGTSMCDGSINNGREKWQDALSTLCECTRSIFCWLGLQ